MLSADAIQILNALEAYFAREKIRLGYVCGKTQYTCDTAKLALAQVRNRRASRNAERRTYRCGTCGFYHLTSTPK